MARSGLATAALLALTAALLIAQPACADKRIALVIGNAAYSSLPALATPRNEAVEIGNALRRLGYEATVVVDLDKRAMSEAIKGFSGSAGGADVALFYFTGHGYRIGSESFLISTDTVVASESDLISSIRLTDVIRGTRAMKAAVFLLDCDASNPFAAASKDQRGPSTGAVEPSLGSDIFIGYSTSGTAEEGGAPLSPFASAFLKRADEAGDIRAMFTKIIADVTRATDGRQTPVFFSSLAGELSLRAAP